MSGYARELAGLLGMEIDEVRAEVMRAAAKSAPSAGIERADEPLIHILCGRRRPPGTSAAAQPE